MWKQLEARVPHEHVADLENLLEELGALSVTLTDPEDTPVLEPGVGETPLWPDVVVAALFDFEADSNALLAAISVAGGINEASRIRISKVEDKDWERAWMDDFHPMKFGDDLWIVPGGQEAPEPESTIIKLDPGLAFGSGTHPTTRLCLEWIDRQILDGLTVIDFGCGSGILGIAAALKKAARVWGVDNDPQALIATADNAARNQVEETVVTLSADAFSAGKAEVIVANILAGTLVQLAPMLCSHLKPGGRIALSGILKDQAAEVRECYSQYLRDIQTVNLEDWVLISGIRRESET
jgi:ribosomal protein L11 methyltransferase